jgi:hypothetical protein
LEFKENNNRPTKGKGAGDGGKGGGLIKEIKTRDNGEDT